MSSKFDNQKEFEIGEGATGDGFAAAAASSKIAVIAHGNQHSGSFSNPRIKIITRSGQALTFDEARAYIGGQNFPEYASSSLGDFGELSDEDCQAILGRIPGNGPGLVDTGLVVLGRGIPIFALRNQELSFAELGILPNRMKKDFILLACRS